MHTKPEDLQTPKPLKNVSKRTAASRDLGIQPLAPLGTGPISSLRLRKERQVGLRGSNRANQGSGGSLIIAGPRENHHLTKLLIHPKVITCTILRKQQICLRRMDSKIKLSRITTFHLLSNQCNFTSEVNRISLLSRTPKPQTSVSASSVPSPRTLMSASSEKPTKTVSPLS